MAKQQDEKQQAQFEAQADAKQLANQNDRSKQIDDLHAAQFQQNQRDFDDLDGRDGQGQSRGGLFAGFEGAARVAQDHGLAYNSNQDPRGYAGPQVSRGDVPGQGSDYYGQPSQDPLQNPNQSQNPDSPANTIAKDGLIAGAGALAYKHRDAIKSGVGKTVDGVKSGAGKVVDGVKSAMTKSTHTMTKGAKEAGNLAKGATKDASKVSKFSKLGKFVKVAGPVGAAAALAVDAKQGKVANVALDAVGMVPGPVGFAADAASIVGVGDKMDKGLKSVNAAGRSTGGTMQNIAKDSVKQSKNFAPTVTHSLGKTAQAGLSM